MIREPLSRFQKLWRDCLLERPPDPGRSAGALMEWLANLLGGETVQYDKLPDAAAFLLDLGHLSLKGIDLNVVFVSRSAARSAAVARSEGHDK